MDEIKQLFAECCQHLNTLDTEIKLDKSADSIKIISTIRKLENEIIPKLKATNHEKLINLYTSGKRPDLVNNICYINNNIKMGLINDTRICHSGTKNSIMKERVNEFIIKFIDTIFPIMIY